MVEKFNIQKIVNGAVVAMPDEHNLSYDEAQRRARGYNCMSTEAVRYAVTSAQEASESDAKLKDLRKNAYLYFAALG